MSKLKKEIEAAAVAAIKCPTCKRDAGLGCMTIRAEGHLGFQFPTTTHKRRLSKYVSENVGEASTLRNEPERVGEDGE